MYNPRNKEDILADFQDVFQGLGCLEGEYHIVIDDSITPVQHAPRRVPIPLKQKLREKLDKMEQDDIIAKVSEPTEWISSLVAVQKPGKLRICIDPRDLNKAIQRPKYPMPSVDEVLPKLAKARLFSVLDAKDGFHQVKLDESSSFLTTFWTPFGRYRYLRLPQGATLLQGGQPITFASRSLTHAEQNYAQIEKECLAILFACCRFDQYLHGRDKISVQTDHKPLVPIFLKSLYKTPKRLQRMLLRLQKYSLDVQYLPGSQMYIADLSRAYQKVDGVTKDSVSDYQIFQMAEQDKLYQEMEQINQVEYMCLSDNTYLQIKTSTSRDLGLQTLMSTVMSGWPDSRDQVPVNIREYWTYRD